MFCLLKKGSFLIRSLAFCFFIFCIAFCLFGCVPQQTKTNSTVSKTNSLPSLPAFHEHGTSPDLSKVTMKTEFSEYSKNVEEINVIITNENSFDEYAYSFDIFSLERYGANGTWEKVDFKKGGEQFLYMDGIIPPNQSVVDTNYVSKHYSLPLKKGKYRIKKDTLYAEFEIK